MEGDQAPVAVNTDRSLVEAVIARFRKNVAEAGRTSPGMPSIGISDVEHAANLLEALLKRAEVVEERMKMARTWGTSGAHLQGWTEALGAAAEWHKACAGAAHPGTGQGARHEWMAKQILALPYVPMGGGGKS